MKAIIINSIGVLLWVLLGHFFPMFHFVTPFYLPILFSVVLYLFGKTVNFYLYTSACHVLLLLNDMLFRIFGGGDLDKQGRDFFEIIFYLALPAVSITLLGLGLSIENKLKKAQSEGILSFKIILLKVLFTTGIAIVSLVIFKTLNVNLN